MISAIGAKLALAGVQDAKLYKGIPDLSRRTGAIILIGLGKGKA
jgi:hypothetical protein